MIHSEHIPRSVLIALAMGLMALTGCAQTPDTVDTSPEAPAAVEGSDGTDEEVSDSSSKVQRITAQTRAYAQQILAALQEMKEGGSGGASEGGKTGSRPGPRKASAVASANPAQRIQWTQPDAATASDRSPSGWHGQRSAAESAVPGAPDATDSLSASAPPGERPRPRPSRTGTKERNAGNADRLNANASVTLPGASSAPASASAAPDSSSSPAKGLGGGEVDPRLKRLAADLLRRARRSSGTLKPWLARAALGAIHPRLELTAEDLGGLSVEDRHVVLAYQRFFTQIPTTTGPGPPADRKQLKLAAEELDEQLNETGRLRIKALRLCRSVRGYGVYDPFEDHTFLAGRVHPMIIYAELENFAAKINDNDRYVVRLTQKVVLYSAADGLAVWRQPPVSVVDKSRNRRRDFFIVQVIRLPATLTAGKYRLKVTITDEIGHYMDQAVVPIHIVADRGLAGAS